MTCVFGVATGLVVQAEKIAKALMQQKIDLRSLVDSTGLTPLMVACDRDQVQMVKWLLQTSFCDVSLVVV